MDQEDKKIRSWCMTTAFGLLMGGNLYWVSRMADNVESTQKTTWELRQEIVILKYTVEEMRQNQKRQEK